MKVFLSLFTLSLASQTLLAQSKPAVRQATPVKRSTVARTAVTPAKKPAPAVQYVAPQPTPAPQEQPRQEQPTTVYVAPRTQAAPARRPTAQTYAPVSANASGFRIGFRVGANSSTIGGLASDDVKTVRTIGFHGGVLFNFGGPNFSVQPEILYTQYGIKMTDGPDYAQLKYNLIEVPVLLKASFGQPNLRFFVNAGPVGSYTMGGTVTIQEGGQSQSGKIDMTGSGRLSFGLTGGAGVAIQAGPGAVQLEARYSYLFSSTQDGTKIHPQTAMLSVGYLIPMGGR